MAEQEFNGRKFAKVQLSELPSSAKRQPAAVAVFLLGTVASLSSYVYRIL